MARETLPSHNPFTIEELKQNRDTYADILVSYGNAHP